MLSSSTSDSGFHGTKWVTGKYGPLLGGMMYRPTVRLARNVMFRPVRHCNLLSHLCRSASVLT